MSDEENRDHFIARIDRAASDFVERGRMRARAAEMRVENGGKFLEEFSLAITRFIEPVFKETRRILDERAISAIYQIFPGRHDAILRIELSQYERAFIRFTGNPDSRLVEQRSGAYDMRDFAAAQDERTGVPKRVLPVAQMDLSTIQDGIASFIEEQLG